MEKIILITKKTPLEELVERFNTREQARFYIEHLGESFDEYEAAHNTYQESLRRLKESLPRGVRWQTIDRSFLPTFTFGEDDLAVTLGPDGLVVNTAKYLSGQQLVAFNPDPRRIDGVLIPFPVRSAPVVLAKAVRGALGIKPVSMASATLNDGQTLYAVNDLFIGRRSHVSARYQIRCGKLVENQSSSGIIVSTGAGSTGWFRSVLTGAAGIVEGYFGAHQYARRCDDCRFDWEADCLYYTVREPFVSKVSSARQVFGKVEGQEQLEIVSQMPQDGVIFSDGVEEDYLQFNSGAVAHIGLADRKLHLAVS